MPEFFQAHGLSHVLETCVACEQEDEHNEQDLFEDAKY